MSRRAYKIGGRACSPGSLVQQGSLLRYEPELLTYIDGLATPLSTAQKGRINTLIKSLKSGLSITNLSDAFDVIRVYAGETAESSLRNIVQRSNDATAVNSPVFTQFEGFTGNGTSNYIEENWNGRVDAVNYLLDSATYGLYFRVFATGADKLNGVYSTLADGGTGKVIRLGSRLATQNIYTDINSSISNTETNYPNPNGFSIITRNNSASVDYYLNKNKENIVRGSSDIPNQGLVTLGRRTTDGSVGLFADSQVSALILGKGFNETEVGIINDAFEAYMDANGKGVI